MPKKLTSARRQLVYSFFTLTFIFLIGVLLAYLLFNQSKKIRQFRNDLSQVHFKTTRIFNAEMSFLLSEENDFKFHRTHFSTVLIRHHEWVDDLINQINSMENANTIFFEDLNQGIDSTKILLIEHNKTFNKLVNLVKKRGFKDYGLVGKMRHQIHALEDNPGSVKMAEILTLRRHEKDYLLRDDSAYINKLNVLANDLLQDLEKDQLRNQMQITYLNNYQNYFNQLANLNLQIGGFLQNGEMRSLQSSIDSIEDKMNIIKREAGRIEENLIFKLRISLYGILSCLFLISIFMSIRLANLRAKPIKQLAKAINGQDKNSRFSINVNLPNASREIQELLEAFQNLLIKLEKQFLITEEKTATLEHQNVELKKVNEELDKFVYSVSHDLRSPLLSILGLINLTRKETNLDVIYENLELKEKSIKKLDSFIGDIIDLSRNSRVDITTNTFDVNELVEQIIEQQKFSPNFDAINFKVVINKPLIINTDRRRLLIIFNNLLSNAVRYADLHKEYPFIIINISIINKNLELKVTDNGVGIQEKHQAKIFNMFYRAHEYKVGSGLGLYICQETINKLNGSIEVQSEAGKGSTFVVKIPVEEPAQFAASLNHMK